MRIVSAALAAALLFSSGSLARAQLADDPYSDRLDAAQGPETGLTRPEGSVSSAGSFQYEIPIEIPEGRAGVAPELSIHYASTRGNGSAGLGAVLRGVPALTRVDAGEGVQFMGNDSYAFLPEGWGSAPSTHHTLVKGGSGRMHTARWDGRAYVPFGTCGDGPCRWEVHDGEGTTWYFGGDEYAHAGLYGVGWAFTLWERYNGKTWHRGIRTWGLYKVEDAHGNSWRVEYLDGPGTLYPSRITYTHHPQLQPVVREVLFQWEERLDATRIPARMTQRLRAVEPRSDAKTVRCYVLTYAESPSSGRSILDRVSEHALCDPKSPAVDSFTFGWSGGTGYDIPLGPVQTMPHAWQRLAQSDEHYPTRDWQTHLGDINGDGRDDLVRVSLGHHLECDVNCHALRLQYALSNGAGFDVPVSLYNDLGATTGVWNDWNSVMGDVDGDGLQDLVLWSLLSSGGQGSRKSLEIKVAFGQRGPAGSGGLGLLQDWGGYSIPDYHIDQIRHWSMSPGDFNGDGQLDLVFFHHFRRDAYTLLGTSQSGLFSSPQHRHWTPSPGTDMCLWDATLSRWEQDPDYCLNSLQALVRDYDGDGRDDLAIVYTAQLFAEGIQDGRIRLVYAFGEPGGLSSFTDIWQAGDSRAPWRLVGGDLNGDGRADLGYQHIGHQGHVANGAGYPWGKDLRASFGPFLDIPKTFPHPLVYDTLVTNAAAYRAPAITGFGGYQGPTRFGWFDHHAADLDGDGQAEMVHLYRGEDGLDLDVTRVGLDGLVYGPMGSPDGSYHLADHSNGEYDGPNYEYLWTSYVGDFNGDGLGDLLSTHFGRNNLAIETLEGRANSAHGFEPSGLRRLNNCGSSGCFDHWEEYGLSPQILLGDINGDGKQDVVFAPNSNAWSFTEERWLPELETIRYSLARTGRVDMVVAVDTHFGGTTSVWYDPAVEVPGAIAFTDGCGGSGPNPAAGWPGCGRPRTDARWLVTRLSRDNGRGLVEEIEYAYENGRASGFGTDFLDRGFERVTETHTQTGLQTVTLNYQWPPFEGLPKQVDVRDGSGALVKRTTYERDQAFIAGGSEASQLVGQVETTWEGGVKADTRTMTWSWDAWGHPDTETTCWDSVKHCVHKTTAFGHDPGPWLMARVDGLQVHNGLGLIISWDKYWYVPGTKSVNRHERLLFEDAANAYCSGKTIGEECAPEISKGDARWVVLERDHQYHQGNLVYVRDALGRATWTTWDATWKIHKVTERNTQGLEQHWGYDWAGRKLSETDVAGNTTTWGYDDLGRKKRVIPPLPGVPSWGNETFAYNGWGNPFQQNVSHTRWASPSSAAIAIRWFDGFGDVVEELRSDFGQGSVHRRWETEYRTVPLQPYKRRVARYSAPYFCASANSCDTPVWFEVTYDAQDRPLTVVRIDTQGQAKTLVSYAYGPMTVEATDAEGRVTTQRLDGRGLLVEQTDADKQVTRYYHSDAGRLLQVDLPNKDRVHIRYDSFGRVRWTDDPDAGRTDFDYNDVGKLVRVEDALKRVTTFTYDGADRVSTKTNSGGTTHFYYDEPGIPNGRGRLTTVFQPNGTETRIKAYDEAGRITERAVKAGLMWGYATHEYDYDWLGRLKTKTLPDGTVQANYYHPANGPLARVEVDGVEWARFPSYEATLQMAERVTMAGTHTWMGYNADGRLDSLLTLGTNTGEYLQDATYKYHPAGALHQLTDRRPSTLVMGVDTDTSAHYFYDALGRLTLAFGDQLPTAEYAYDEVGHFTRKGDVYVTRLYCGVGGHCLEGRDGPGNLLWRATHDAAGQRERFEDFDAGVTWEYAYDDDRRLTEVWKDGQLVAEMAYGFAGDRVWKNVHHANGDSTRTYYFGGDYEERASSAGLPGVVSVTKHILAEQLRIATWTDGGFLPGMPFHADVYAAQGPLSGTTEHGVPIGVWFHHPNHLASAGVVTDVGGQVVTRYSYEPWGAALDSSVGFDGTTHTYTGQENDAATGLKYYGARYYDPLTGRFVTPDPALPGEGLDPQGFNRFSYVMNNPVNFTDPTGFTPELPDEIIIQGVRYKVVEVKEGDSLSKLAKEHLGSYDKTPVLAKANPQITNQRYIYPGNTILVPIGPAPAPAPERKPLLLWREPGGETPQPGSAEPPRQLPFERGLTRAAGEVFGPGPLTMGILNTWTPVKDWVEEGMGTGAAGDAKVVGKLFVALPYWVGSGVLIPFAAGFDGLIGEGKTVYLYFSGELTE